MKTKNKKYVQTTFFDIKGCFEISLFEISRVDCNNLFTVSIELHVYVQRIKTKTFHI